MSEDRGAPQGAGERRRGGFFADLSPLRQSPAFARLWAGSSIAGIGMKTQLKELATVGIKPVLLMLGETVFLVTLVLALLHWMH